MRDSTDDHQRVFLGMILQVVGGSALMCCSITVEHWQQCLSVSIPLLLKHRKVGGSSVPTMLQAPLGFYTQKHSVQVQVPDSGAD